MDLYSFRTGQWVSLGELAREILEPGECNCVRVHVPAAETMSVDDRRYVAAVARTAAFEPDTIARWFTPMCPECEESPRPDDEHHVMVGEQVVIGCLGYHVVDPNAVGLDGVNWIDWTDAYL